MARKDRLFHSFRDVDQQQPVLRVREDDEIRTLVDPNTLSADFTVTLDAFSPSLDGRLVAYQLSEGGDEESVLRVLDVDTGEVVDGPIDRCRYSPVAWLPDASGFFYMRYLAEAPDGRGDLHRRVWFHPVGGDPDHDAQVHGADSEPGTYYALDVSVDGRWLLVASSVGTEPRNDLWIGDLAAADDPGRPDLHPIQVGLDAETWGSVIDGRLVLRTDLDAPRSRLVTADPSDPAPQRWRDLVPEAEGVLVDWVLTGDALVVARTVDVAARVSVHDPESGEERGTVALPGLGTVGLSSDPARVDDRVWIAYSDFVTPGVVLEHRTASGITSTWATAPGAPEVDDVEARQLFVTSPDGTRVPMFVLSRRGSATAPRPTVLYGYGGFNVSLDPAFSSSIVAWVQAGGVWAVANLRGGSEYGEEWHRAGMRERKQNVFDDFFACAEHLVSQGITSPQRLGISGGSNGGLLVGAALTQRPDLFRSVVCSAPLLDMVRYEEFGLGRTWNDEYGQADDPTELSWLLGYSPYHRVRQGVAYPAVLFTVFESDTRVDPLHARKMCAALQWATSSDPATHPVLLRREIDVGHGQRSVARTVALAADQLAFHAWALSLDPD